LNIYKNKKENNFFQTYRVGRLLMNKLCEEKRYDDVVRVFDKLEASVFIPKEGEYIDMENILDALNQQV
jgi:pentatricopeptide repeat protein